jgi:hypothetical protein
MMVLISIEQRMLLQSQLTALAGRVVEEEGGCNSTVVSRMEQYQATDHVSFNLLCTVYDIKSDLVDL